MTFWEYFFIHIDDILEEDLPFSTWETIDTLDGVEQYSQIVKVLKDFYIIKKIVGTNFLILTIFLFNKVSFICSNLVVIYYNILSQTF